MIRASASIVIGVIVFTHQPEAVASATFFGYSSDKTNAWLDFSFTVFKGSVSAGDVRFQQSGCVDVSATINGVAYHDGGLINQIEIEQLTATLPAPFHLDGYVDGIHMELYVEDAGLIGWSTPRSDVTSTGGFTYKRYSVSLTPESGPIWMLLENVMQYDFPLYYVTFPFADNYTLAGNVRIDDEVPSIETRTSSSWTTAFPGTDYNIKASVALWITVPEPGAIGLLILLLPLAATIRNRR